MVATITGEPLDIAYTQKQDLIYNRHPKNYQFVCVPKGRRSGGTNGAVNYVIEQCCSEKRLHILWTDTVQANLPPLYNRYFFPILKQLKSKLYSYNASSHELKLFNSVVYFRSAERPQSMEGFAFDLIILNEAGIILKGSKGRNLWFNTLYPMVLDYNANVFFVGTPKGKKKRKNEFSETGQTLFYELCLKGLHSEDKKWITEEMTTYDNPFLDEESIAELEQDVPFYIRDQEIYGKFLDRGDEEIFHLEWFKTTANKIDTFNIKRLILSLDTAFKKTDISDYSACVAIAETHAGMYYIIDMFNEKLEFPELIEKTKEFLEFHPNANYIVIEDKASGQSLIQVLRRELAIPIKGIIPTIDKLARASSCSLLFESQKVMLFEAPWNKELIDQMCSFSGNYDTYDDIVDCVSQGLNFLSSTSSTNSKGIVRRKVLYNSKSLARY